ncbi:MAG: T9SS type A sorting domain-containing protein [Bacteroidetes bacterium]|nr:T9SS type A sorting domain-containing protein [Bacteroidota bacterium]
MKKTFGLIIILLWSFSLFGQNDFFENNNGSQPSKQLLVNTGSAYFNNNARIRVLDSSPINPNANNSAYVITGHALTIEAWVFPIALPEQQSSKIILSRPYIDGEPWRAYDLTIGNWTEEDKPVFTFGISDGSVPQNAAFANDPDPALAGEWVHIAGTYDGSFARLYKNGNLVAEVEYHESIGVGDAGFYIGGLKNVERYFDGLIDEVRVWNVVRSQNEINASMNVTLNGNEPGLMGYWPLDEATEVNGIFPATIDKTEYHNDLQVQNDASFVSFIPGSEVSIPPTLSDLDNVSATVGENFEIIIPSAGYNYPNFSISNFPDGMSINQQTGLLSWTPSINQVGWHSFNVNAANPAGTDDKTYNIWVNAHAQEELVHTNGRMNLSIFNDGVLGRHRGQDGVGFNLDGMNGLFTANLLLGQSANQVSGRLNYVEFGRTNPINQIENVWEGFDQVYYTEYNDAKAQDPIDVTIAQRSHCISTDATRNFIIVEYAVINNSDAKLNDLYIGIAADWDIGSAYNNLGGFDESRNLSYMYEDPATVANISNPNYYGIVALNSQVSGHRVWFNSVDFDENSDISYFEALTNRFDILNQPGDVRAIIGTGPYTIPTDVMAKSVFALVAGVNLEDLQAQADDAINTYASFAPSITLNSPNGGETLEAGSTYDITWDSQNVETVALVYSSDNAVTWSVITTEDANIGTYTWTVPNTPSSECFVGITYVNDINVNDVSDSPFVINAALPTYTTEYFVDDFEDGDALGWELDNSWHVADVDGNHVLAGGDPSWQGAFIGDNSWKNYQVSIDFKILSGAMQLSFKNNTANNYRYIINVDASINYVTFSKSDTQTDTSIDEIDLIVQTNQWHNLVAYYYDDHVRVYFNNRLIFSYMDPVPIQYGRVWISNAPNSSIYIDNVRVLGEIKLACNPSSWNVSAGAGIKHFTITSNAPWNVSSNANWLTLDPTTGSGDETIAVNYYANLGTTSRSASIIVTSINASASDAPITLTVTQAGNSYPTTITLSNTVSFPNHDDPGDYRDTDYRLVGFPGNSGRSISSFLSGSQSTNWQVYRDNGTNGDRSSYYVVYDGGSLFNCTIGRAFWIINKGTLTISDVEVSAADVNSDGMISVPLAASRWNLITSPIWSSVAWSIIRTINGDVQAPTYWNGTSLTVASSLDPYRGYIFDNTGSTRTELLVPAPGFERLYKEENIYEWKIDIAVSNGEFEDKTTSLGISENASRELDNFDARKGRIFGEIPMAYFYRPDWDENNSMFRSDIRSSIEGIEEWDFVVSSRLNDEINLTFESIAEVPDEYDVFLVDNNLAKSVNLREEAIYTFTSSRTETPMCLLIGEENLIENKLEEITPRDFELINNYPNPFNLSTKIGVKIPEREDIVLEVYNILGQKIKTIYKGRLDSGIHYFDWDARDDYGAIVTSGIYLCRMNTLKNILSKKMVLIK